MAKNKASEYKPAKAGEGEHMVYMITPESTDKKRSPKITVKDVFATSNKMERFVNQVLKENI